ncbi:MAG: PDZ domain-containing protein [Chthoniobacteraceae bacterium]|nr:PDZ domain-containing protein [Chthoniobacteraceae bacterium]
MPTRFAFLGALLASALLAVPSPLLAKAEHGAAAAASTPAAAAKAVSVVRVNATSQPYDFLRPWSKRPPYQRRAAGAVLPGGRVLTTAEQVANATYLELEKPDSGEKSPATLEIVDYECNLALLKPADPAFLASFKPLTVGEASAGDDLAIWQLEANGTVLNTRALLTTVEVGEYPFGDTGMLLYRLTTSLQPRESGFTSPLVKAGALTGMLLRFDSRSQTADAIPAPVIRHFLQAASAKGGYVGFPHAGMHTAPLRDPQLRHYAGLANGTGGVYIRQVHPGGPADQAGVQKGDVLVAIGNNAIDQDGNYADPHYGKISIQHQISCANFDGAKVPFKIMRQGKEMTLPVTLRYQDPSQSIIEPFTVDKAPRYYVLGGLIFQELSRQFLKEWGSEWIHKAPERFLYYDAYQEELFRDDPRSRIVIMSNVLPSPCTVGYEELNCLVVTKINGVELKSLADIEPALAKPVEGFHHITFLGHPGEIVIDAAQAAAIEKPLMRNYGLPAIKRL